MAKLAVFLAIFAFSYCAFAYPGKKWDENGIKKLLEEAINKFAAEGKKHSPLHVPKLPTHKSKGPGYDLNVDLSNVDIWTPDVDIKNLDVKLTPTELHVQKQLQYDNEIIKSDMRISGKMGEDDVDQTGTYEANWSDIMLQTDVKLQHDANSVSISSIDFVGDYALPKTTLTGFSFKGITNEELEKRSSAEAHDVAVKQLEFIKKHIPNAILYINRLLKGRNLDDILDYLDRIVHPK